MRSQQYFNFLVHEEGCKLGFKPYTMSSKFPIKSIFEQIASQIFTSTDTLINDKRYVISFVESKDINDKDKKTIIRNVNECGNKTRLQMYIANSLLKYEGLSVNNHGTEDFIENQESFC